jgi:hypothetical protein
LNVGAAGTVAWGGLRQTAGEEWMVSARTPVPALASGIVDEDGGFRRAAALALGKCVP